MNMFVKPDPEDQHGCQILGQSYKFHGLLPPGPELSAQGPKHLPFGVKTEIRIIKHAEGSLAKTKR